MKTQSTHWLVAQFSWCCIWSSVRLSCVHQSLMPLLTEHMTRLYSSASFALNVDMTEFWPVKYEQSWYTSPPGLATRTLQWITHYMVLIPCQEAKNSMAQGHGRTQGASSLRPWITTWKVLTLAWLREETTFIGLSNWNFRVCYSI